jgi:hypothetical protein
MRVAVSSVTSMRVTCGDDTAASLVRMRLELYPTTEERGSVLSGSAHSSMSCTARSLIAVTVILFFQAGHPLVVTRETRLVRLRLFCYTFIGNVGERYRSDRP